jgi:hypothetical protein
VRDRRPFAVNLEQAALEYFPGKSRSPALAINLSQPNNVELDVTSWIGATSDVCAWSETCREPGITARHVIAGLSPNAPYALSQNGRQVDQLRSNAAGQIVFSCAFSSAAPLHFRLTLDRSK